MGKGSLSSQGSSGLGGVWVGMRPLTACHSYRWRHQTTGQEGGSCIQLLALQGSPHTATCEAVSTHVPSL